MPLRKKTFKNFLSGLINSIEDFSIKEDASSDSNNWLTQIDKFALRRGMEIKGTELTGAGEARTYTAHKIDGTDITFRARGQKIEYYDTATSDWIEVGTNILGSAANGEDVSFAQYTSLAGAQLWISSPNSSLFKIMLANPGSYTDIYLANTNYKGYIRIKQNRMFLWRRNADKTGIYLSWIDSETYTTVSAEVLGSGNGTTKTFTGTLAFKAAGARRTCFAISVTDSTETFSDNRDGTLTGTLGGTGTINYTSGAISVTFNTAPAIGTNNITVTYQWEDSTNDGIADFTFSATRVAGEGDVFRQDDGGDTQSVLSYEDVEYCLHKKKIWVLTLTRTDTNATNLIFREKIGIPYWRAAVATGDGIYLIDNSDEKDPKFRLLTLASNSTKVIPRAISNNLDLSDYRFNEGVVEEFGDFILFSCRHKDFSYNQTIFAYNKKYKLWDKLDYFASSFSINNGVLWAGDSISNNVFELFSGLDDDGSEIANYRDSNLSDLDIDALKKTKRFVVEGEIGPNQEIRVYMAFDNGAWVEIGADSSGNPAIRGSGSYVDKSQSINVGAMTLGQSEVGGGGGDGAIPAYHFKKEMKINQDKFYKVKVRFQAIGIGWAAISQYQYKDIRKKHERLPTKYR